MTLTFELDLESVRMNQLAEYLGQNSFSSKVIAQARASTGHARRSSLQPQDEKRSFIGYGCIV